jgi:GntR family transcriptional regulator
LILNSDSMKPIYIQIAEWLETEILGESIKVDEKVYSQYQLAEMLNINPATAAKGLNILADENILYKKRGLGMFVTQDAKKIITAKRRDQTLKSLVADLVREAENLQVTEEELFAMIQEAKRDLKGDS